VISPSGEQHELRHGAQHAVIVEVGGALRAYEVSGRARFDGYGADERATGARGHPLIPWPNRLRDGRYRFAGAEHQLALTEPAQGNAIHGLVRWANWRAIERSADRVVMAHTLHPREGWPFALQLALAYALDEDGLTVTTTATNVGAEPCPFGAGQHPYLTLGTPTVDALQLELPAATRLCSDERGIPTGSEPVRGTAYDFRRPRPIGDTVLDTAYTDLRRDADGRARVRLRHGSDAVTLWMDGAYGWVMAFTGDPLPEVDRRRRGLGIEPMTCAPNALQSGDGLRTLAPGERTVARWGITPG
jgi:aldose 1-epimerase